MLDGPLSRLVDCNKIRVGDKLCVFGSDLVGLNDAATPLEVFLRVLMMSFSLPVILNFLRASGFVFGLK